MQFNNYLLLKKVFFIEDISLSDADIERIKTKHIDSNNFKITAAGAKMMKLNFYRPTNPFRIFPNLKVILQEKLHMNKNGVEVTIKFPPIFLFFYALLLVFFVVQFFVFSPLRENGMMISMPLVAPFFFYLVLLVNFLMYLGRADREIREVLKKA